jgi:uncharacterized membrane protein YcaP (DUF421 family)
MELVIRATVIYWFLWLVVRGTGKRSLAEISPLDLLIIVVLGDFVQQGVTGEDMSVTGAIIVVSTFVLWMLLGDLVARRSRTVRRVFEGEPVIVVSDGKPLVDRIRIERLTLDEVYGAAREHGFGDLTDVKVGVLEADGNFSFIGHQPPGPGAAPPDGSSGSKG